MRPVAGTGLTTLHLMMSNSLHESNFGVSSLVILLISAARTTDDCIFLPYN